MRRSVCPASSAVDLLADRQVAACAAAATCIAIYIWRERVDLPRDPFPDAQRSARIKADVPQPPPPIAHVEGALAAMEVTHEHRPSRPFQSAHGWITELQESRGHGSTYA